MRATVSLRQVCEGKNMSDPMQKGALRVVGFRQVLRALRNEKALRVYLADDASASMKDEVIAAAAVKNVPVQKVASMRALARMCSVDVPASAAAVIEDTE